MIIGNNITKIFNTTENRSGVMALKNISFAIQPGEITLILGPSGSGKTSLMNIIGGIDKNYSGDLSVNKEKLNSFTNSQLTVWRRECVSFIFQDFNLFPYLSAYENIEYALQIKKISRTKNEMMQALERVGMADRAKHKPSQLSGGQIQRVAIARSIVANSEILLADEPTASLDADNADNIFKVLSVLKSEKKYIIIVTHNAQLVKSSDKVIYIHDGEISNEKPC